jgi:hypothetical protein
MRVLNTRRREKARLPELNRQPARLREEFARLNLLDHFRSRAKPKFFAGFDDLAQSAALCQTYFPDQTEQLIARAHRITDVHCWPLLGFGDKCYGAEQIEWHRDLLSGFQWPLDYHADINLLRKDGSDVRVVWELNRMAQLITLGRAYHATTDEKFSQEFFRQAASWREHNPVGRGVNWNCAMEVALRAMNMLAAFFLFLHAPQMDEAAVRDFLALFDQHGAHIERNLEFSHIATSNHYLADITGLLWLGLMLPELQAAGRRREFGLRELLNEMDRQTLPDGADYEASIGYHRLKVELLLYSFLLCRVNGVEIEAKYWSKLRAMLNYVRAYLRPDGRAPLIGDSDSGQALPIVPRSGDDHSYLLAMGAAIFQEPRFKLKDAAISEELVWLLGQSGVRDYQALSEGEPQKSEAFPDAGIYILRHEDMYLLFNASDSGVHGRGSHGHNDALSIEVSACGTPFIVDPGTYVYTADLRERHLFRSTAYHSTVQVDGEEQNSIDEAAPFIIGNEAQPRVLEWQPEFETVTAEHLGYRRLSQPVTHQRKVAFVSQQRYWHVSDKLMGEGNHQVAFRFHFAPGLETTVRKDGSVKVHDKANDASLLIVAHQANAELIQQPELENRFSSRDYGAKTPSYSACWHLSVSLPLSFDFVIVPVRAGEDEDSRLSAALEWPTD